MDKRARMGFGALSLFIALLLGVGVFRFLPTRWWVVDVPSVLVVCLLAANGVALLRNVSVAERIARVTGIVVLVLGMALVTGLVTAAGALSGVFGAVGIAGMAVFVLVLLLVIPYLVVFPAAMLAWIGPAKK